MGWKMLGAMVLAAGLAAGCSTHEGGGEAAPQDGYSAFQGIEREIFVPHCVRVGCHGGETPAGGLNLSEGNAYRDLVGVKASRRPESLRVDPGHPDASYLMNRLEAGGDSPRMPLMAKPLSEADFDRIRTWIQDGAKP